MPIRRHVAPEDMPVRISPTAQSLSVVPQLAIRLSRLGRMGYRMPGTDGHARHVDTDSTKRP